MKDPDQLEKALLTPNEASRRFNVPLRTIYFWYRTGNIKGVNLNGKCLRIFGTSIQEFLRAKCRPVTREGSAGRRGKLDRVADLSAKQAGQTAQQYEREGQGRPRYDGSGPKGDGEALSDVSPAEMDMLKTLVERADSPGYLDWAGMDTGTEQ